jgi:hypothetical protein
VISDAPLRRRFTGAMRGIVPHVNTLGLAACEAAYRDCDEWHAALIGTLRANWDRIESALCEASHNAVTGNPCVTGICSQPPSTTFHNQRLCIIGHSGHSYVRLFQSAMRRLPAIRP